MGQLVGCAEAAWSVRWKVLQAACVLITGDAKLQPPYSDNNVGTRYLRQAGVTHALALTLAQLSPAPSPH